MTNNAIDYARTVSQAMLNRQLGAKADAEAQKARVETGSPGFKAITDMFGGLFKAIPGFITAAAAL